MTNKKVILQDVRGSYVFLQEPRKNEDGSDGKYSIQVLIPKNDPQVKKIKKAIDMALTEKFGEKATKKRGAYKLPLRDGDDERDTPEYEGMYFINVNGARKPGIVNRSGENADSDDLEDYCYSGAYFHVSINFYGFAVDGNKGVAAGMGNIMLRKKGERLDGSVSATSEFSEYASDDDDDEDDGFGTSKDEGDDDDW